MEPSFRAQNQAQIPASSNKSNQNQNHGFNFVPGIWAPECARIPAQENRRSGTHPSQKTGRPPATFLSREPHLKYGLSHVRSPPLLPVPWGHIQAFFSTANHSFECCKGIGIFKRKSCDTRTHGNGTPSPKTSPTFRVRFGDRFFLCFSDRLDTWPTCLASSPTHRHYAGAKRLTTSILCPISP